MAFRDGFDVYSVKETERDLLACDQSCTLKKTLRVSVTVSELGTRESVITAGPKRAGKVGP